MGELEQGSFDALLKSFDLGPQWAKGSGGSSEKSPERRREEKRWEKEEGDGRDGRRQSGDGAKGRQPRRVFEGDRQGRRHEGGRDSGRRSGGRHPDSRRRGPDGHGDTWVDLSSVAGVAVRFDPAPGAVAAVTSQIRARGMTCSLYDLARLLVVDPVRCRATLESSKRGPEFFVVRQGGEGLFLSREEATAFFWGSDLRHLIFEEEEVEVPPPQGVFVAVARCGMSGQWLGPPNHHTYGENLRRLHRERYSHMRLEDYAARVRTERGEEAVEAWRQTMTRKLRWRVKGATEERPATETQETDGAGSKIPADEVVSGINPATYGEQADSGESSAAPPETAGPAEASEEAKSPKNTDSNEAASVAEWIDSESAVRLLFRDSFFDQVFEQTKNATIGAAPPPNACSPPLREKIKRAWFHARKHPERLIPTLCRLLEASRMPVFKLQGKLYTGPARPHALPKDQGALADRPAALANWILSQEKPKLANLWPAVLPEGMETPSNEWAADFHWLLSQGHLLHFPDDSLRVMVRRGEAGPTRNTESAVPTDPKPEPQVAGESREDIPVAQNFPISGDRGEPEGASRELPVSLEGPREKESPAD